MSCIQRLSNPSHNAQNPYVDVEYIQATRVLFETYRNLYDDQTTACFSILVIKDQSFVYPAFSFGVPELPSLCCIFKGGRNNGCYFDSPCFCKRLRADTVHITNMPNFCLKVCDIVGRFCRTDLAVCLSSQASIMRGL